MTAVSASGLFELSDEQQEIVAAVREFVEREVIPVADELEHRDEFPEKIVERMKELGLFGLTVPEEFGGAGLAPLHTGPPARNAGAPAYRGGWVRPIMLQPPRQVCRGPSVPSRGVSPGHRRVPFEDISRIALERPPSASPG